MNSGTLALLGSVCRVKFIVTDLFSCPVFQCNGVWENLITHLTRWVISYFITDVDIETLHLSTGIRYITSPQSRCVVSKQGSYLLQMQMTTGRQTNI